MMRTMTTKMKSGVHLVGETLAAVDEVAGAAEGEAACPGAKGGLPRPARLAKEVQCLLDPQVAQAVC